MTITSVSIAKKIEKGNLFVSARRMSLRRTDISEGSRESDHRFLKPHPRNYCQDRRCSVHSIAERLAGLSQLAVLREVYILSKLLVGDFMKHFSSALCATWILAISSKSFLGKHQMTFEDGNLIVGI